MSDECELRMWWVCLFAWNFTATFKMIASRKTCTFIPDARPHEKWFYSNCGDGATSEERNLCKLRRHEFTVNTRTIVCFVSVNTSERNAAEVLLQMMWGFLICFLFCAMGCARCWKWHIYSRIETVSHEYAPIHVLCQWSVECVEWHANCADALLMEKTIAST